MKYPSWETSHVLPGSPSCPELARRLSSWPSKKDFISTGQMWDRQLSRLQPDCHCQGTDREHLHRDSASRSGHSAPAVGITFQKTFLGLLVGIPVLCRNSLFNYTVAGDKD